MLNSFEADDPSSSQEPETSLLTAKQAAAKMSKALGLTFEQEAMLTREIGDGKDDSILIVVPNNDWIATHGQAAADQIMDFIGLWPNLQPECRRDIRMRHLVYHFAEFGHVLQCQRALKNAVPAAFASSQSAIACLISLNFIAPNQVQTIPQTAFGRVGVVQKINMQDNDATEFPEFFMT